MGKQGRGTIALLAMVAAVTVVALFAALRWGFTDRAPAPAGVASAPPAMGSQPQASAAPPPNPSATLPASTPSAPSGPATPPVAAATPAPSPATPAGQAAPAPAAPAGQAALLNPPQNAAPAPRPAAPSAAQTAPSFDVVRVEPNGDSVIAGRGAPGATIELLRDGQVHARAAADGSGLFALVPPALAPGSHQIILQSIAPDGVRQRSRETVSVSISEGRNVRPLVALTSPDKPTVVLSSPEAQSDVKAAQAAPRPADRPQQQANAAPPSPQGSPAAPAAQTGPATRAEVKIVTVETEIEGRLFVSGRAAPGATVRLYLNDTFIAPGGAGNDGNVTFAIGRGVKPGDYKIRLDDVDPVSGSVKSRAEVAFNVPSIPAVASSPAAAPVPVIAQRMPAPAAPGPSAGPSSAPAPSAAPTGAATPDRAPAAQASTNPAAVAPPATNPAAAASRPSPQVASASPAVGDIPPSAVLIPDINTSIISRGDSLWRLSQRTYGNGFRYTVIYGANKGQIRNPHLIYPGQVFVLPSEQTKAN